MEIKITGQNWINPTYDFSVTVNDNTPQITGVCPSCRRRLVLHHNKIPWHQVAVWRDNGGFTAVMPNYYQDVCWGGGELGNELRYD